MAELIKNQSRRAFSGWPMFVAWVAMMIFAFHASTHMVAAGDTWVAMACGRHFINHGVDTVEPFSANSHKAGPTEQEVAKWPRWAQKLTDIVGLETVKKVHPTGWVNQNWLTHVLFYWMTHLSPVADGAADNWQPTEKPYPYSYNTLVYWKISLYIASVICVYYIGRLLGVNPALSATLACFAMFAARSFLDIRPAGFSNLLVAVFLLILILSTYRNYLYIWFIVPLTVFWCNVHGGYIYVFIMLAPFVALNFLTSFWPNTLVTIGKRGLIHTIAAGFTTLVACLIFNPFHLTNFTHTFIISVSENAEMWRSVHEWHPALAWSNPVGTGYPFLILLLLTIGLGLYWLFSLLIKPRVLEAPKNVLDSQRRRMEILAKLFYWSLSVFLFWVVCVSLSLANNNFAGLFFFGMLAVIVLLSIEKNINYIYIAIPLVLIAMALGHSEFRSALQPIFGPAGLFRGDLRAYEGRYNLPFLLIPLYITAIGIRRLITQKPLKTRGSGHIWIVIATAIICFILTVVIFHPFGGDKASIGNLASFIKEMPNIRRPWRPAYEANLEGLRKVYNSYWLWGLLIINISALILWWLVPLLHKCQYNEHATENSNTETDEQFEFYRLPKFDIAYTTIALLTVYMAYRSRRFIPIAAFAACPLIAMFIDRMSKVLAASMNFYKNGNFIVPPMPRRVQNSFAIIGTILVVIFGTWVGVKFNRVYLSPWPTDDKLTSVFMRMTASHVKPFWALKFIRQNELSGNMFNYWTEGGFIAYGQIPDADTGETPLKLFMDGRAQAAYDPKAFMRWNNIMGGTTQGAQIIQAAEARGRRLTRQDYLKIGESISKELRDSNVWVVLMPLNVKAEILTNSLDQHPGWAIVFYNNKQKLYVDIDTEQGRKLFQGITEGTTNFPDEFSKRLTTAHILLNYSTDPETINTGFANAMEAVKLNPSQSPMIELLSAVGRFRQYIPTVASFCEQQYEDFIENQELYEQQKAYMHKLTVAVQAANFLTQVSTNQETRQEYQQKMREWADQARKINNDTMW